MQSNYSACLAFTLLYEGGKVDNPKDPGGRTNQGVTQTTYNSFRKSSGLPVCSVYLMTPVERDAIYSKSYWTPVMGDTLPFGVDLAVFDYGVNSGPARALKALPHNVTDAVAEVKAVCASRSSFLHALTTWSTFGKGWATRVAACEALGVKMALNVAAGAPAAAPAPVQVKTVLKDHAAAATKSVATTKKAAAATAAATTVPVVASGGHVSLIVIGALVTAAAFGAAFLVWRLTHQAAKAEAYTAVSKA